jgi:hypothetical protein
MVTSTPPLELIAPLGLSWFLSARGSSHFARPTVRDVDVVQSRGVVAVAMEEDGNSMLNDILTH